MKPPAHSIGDLRRLTPARVGLGRSGAGLPTKALLDFTLDHARARDAVHAAFDSAGLIRALGEFGVSAIEVASRAVTRSEYLRRPDLGRMLAAESRHLLEGKRGDGTELVIVIGDGLSPTAIQHHAVDLLRAVLPRLAQDGIVVGDVVVATGARVALGDEIGEVLAAKMVAVLIGERPGLSAPDSLGVYLTFDPRAGRTDAERNCVSNIHGSGLSSAEAASRIAWLIREGLRRRVSGVALKDESGEVAATLAKPV